MKIKAKYVEIEQVKEFVYLGSILSGNVKCKIDIDNVSTFNYTVLLQLRRYVTSSSLMSTQPGHPSVG